MSATRFEFDLDKLPPLLRLSDICRDPKRNYPGLLPIVKSSFLELVSDGLVPEPVRFGRKAVAWKREDIIKLIQEGVPIRRRA